MAVNNCILKSPHVLSHPGGLDHLDRPGRGIGCHWRDRAGSKARSAGEAVLYDNHGPFQADDPTDGFADGYGGRRGGHGQVRHGVIKKRTKIQDIENETHISNK